MFNIKTFTKNKLSMLLLIKERLDSRNSFLLHCCQSFVALNHCPKETLSYSRSDMLCFRVYPSFWMDKSNNFLFFIFSLFLTFCWFKDLFAPKCIEYCVTVFICRPFLKEVAGQFCKRLVRPHRQACAWNISSKALGELIQ